MILLIMLDYERIRGSARRWYERDRADIKHYYARGILFSLPIIGVDGPLPVCANGIHLSETSGQHDSEIFLFHPVKPAEFAVIDEHCRWKKNAVEKDEGLL